jgi:hypothetical protein
MVEKDYIGVFRHRKYLEKFCRKLTFCRRLWQLMLEQDRFYSFKQKHHADVEPCIFLDYLAAPPISEIYYRNPWLKTGLSTVFLLFLKIGWVKSARRFYGNSGVILTFYAP